MASRDTDTPDVARLSSGIGPQSGKPVGGAIPPVRRYMLPPDLPRALAWLSQDEFDALELAVGAERRRRLVASTEPDRTSKPDAAKRPNATARLNAKVENLPKTTMTRARVNAVRAAFRAGVKPSMLARQFGVPLTAIREALSGTGV